MKLLFLLMLAATFGCVSTVHATDCARAETQIDLNACAGQAYKKSDAQLNAAYKQIMVRLKDNHQATTLLVSAQKSWLGFRDAECAFSSSAAVGGSIYPMLVAQCRDGLTRGRVAQLQGYLACQEGDTGCPVPAN